MPTRNVELINLARIDLLKGRTNTDLDSLSKILIDNYGNRLSHSIDDTSFEDSVCPPNQFVDEIITEMITDFKAATGEDIVIANYWGHIHEKNMSTTLHNHFDSYVSAVCYVNVPVGSGSIVFRPRLNQYDNSAYASKFEPERGVYYMFPSYLDHFVTRNLSEDLRVSISFNFNKNENNI
tara:strand:+ start:563 stop:1102 length:540 start_codon:yes stop_codon:yes gene_type:complete